MRRPLGHFHLGSLSLAFCVALVGSLPVGLLPSIGPIPPLPPLPPLSPPSQIIVSALRVMEFNPYRLYTYQLDGTHTEFLPLHSTDYEYSPGPDSAGDVVFVGDDGNQAEIYFWPAAGGSLVRLTTNSVPDLFPALSPDGTKLVFCRPDPSHPSVTCLWAADFLMGGLANVRQLNYAQSTEPCFSPDGTKIVYAEAWVPPGGSRVIHRLRVYNFNADPASRFTNLLGSVMTTYDQRKPSWSPDGAKIAFALERSAGIYDLALVDGAGGSPVLSTSTQLYDEGCSSWAPTGRELIVESIERASLLEPSQTWRLDHLIFNTSWAVTSTVTVAEIPGTATKNPHPAWVAAPRPLILDDILPRGTVGTAYSYTLRAAGGEGNYQWQMKTGSVLPAGLSLDSVGHVTGIPTQPTPSLTPCRFTVVVRDKSGTGTAAEKLLSLEIMPAASLTLNLGTTLPIAVTGRAYQFPFSITGGQPPYTVSARFYPSGLYGHEVTIPGLALSIDSSTGQWRLSGTPGEIFPSDSSLAGQPVARAYLVTLRVADSRGASIIRELPNFVSLRVVGDLIAPPFYAFAGEGVWSAPTATSDHQFPRSGVAIAGSASVAPTFALQLAHGQYPLAAARRGGADIYWFDLSGIPDWETIAGAESITDDEQQVVTGQLTARIGQGPYADLELVGPVRVYRYSFRHARGLQDENFTSYYTWDEFERFFGYEDCEYAGSGIDTGVASLLFDVFVGPNDGIGEGTCFGMSLYGEKLWNGDPEISGAPPPGTTAWAYGEGTETSHQHLWQLDQGYLEAWIHFFLDHYDELGKATLDQILPTLEGTVAGVVPDWPYLLAIAEGFGSAHSVVPYAYEELPDGWCRIRVYDPNRPFCVCEENDGGSYISINRVTGDWNFSFGDGTVYENAYIVPVQSDVCRGDPDLISDLIEAGGVINDLLDDGWDFLWYILAGATAPDQVSDDSGHTLLTADGGPNLGPTRVPAAGMIPLSGGGTPAGLFFAPKGDDLTFSLRPGGTGGPGQDGYKFGFGTAGGAVIVLEASDGDEAGGGENGGGGGEGWGGLDTLRCDALNGTLEFAPGGPRRCSFSILIQAGTDGGQAGAGGAEGGGGGGRILRLRDLVLGAGDTIRLGFDGRALWLRLLRGDGPLGGALADETASDRGREGFDYGRFSLPAGQEWRFVPGYQPGEPPVPFSLEIDLGADGTVDETRELAGTATKPGPQHGGVVLGFLVGSKIMTVNGVEQAIDVAPMSIEGRTMLPVRYVTDPLGATIAWDQTEGKTIITFGETIIELWIGKNKAMVNGRSVGVDPSNSKVVPLIVGGRTMLPMRFVAENLGCTVEWNAGAITVVGP